MSQAVGVPQFMDRLLQNSLMKERLIRWEAIELRFQTGHGDDRHPLHRVRLSEGEIQVSGVKIDGHNPQDPLHLG